MSFLFFSKNKNDLITSHPTVIRHLQVLAFGHFPNCNEPQCFITILWGFMATRGLFMNNVLRRFYLHYKAWLASSLQWKIRVLSNELPWFDQGKYKPASIISRAYMPQYIRQPYKWGITVQFSELNSFPIALYLLLWSLFLFHVTCEKQLQGKKFQRI